MVNNRHIVRIKVYSVLLKLVAEKQLNNELKCSHIVIPFSLTFISILLHHITSEIVNFKKLLLPNIESKETTAPTRRSVLDRMANAHLSN